MLLLSLLDARQISALGCSVERLSMYLRRYEHLMRKCFRNETFTAIHIAECVGAVGNTTTILAPSPFNE
jgi:hypothetical protein